jgi:hypothetical protein
VPVPVPGWSGAAPSLSTVMIPGATAQLRAASGITGPRDVPAWMTRNGAATRGAAGAMAAAASAVRRVAETIRSLLADTATGLGWQGAAARSAQDRAQDLHDRLVTIAAHLDAARCAFTGLAAVLETQHVVIGSPATAWAQAAGQDRQLALLRQWQPAVQALDAADARAASALGEVASALARIHVRTGGAATGPSAPRSPDAGRDDGPLHAVGEFCANAVNALASFANAVGQNPGDAARLAAGLLMVQAGATGEFAGGTLDATGIGAAVGVPAAVLSAGVIVTGAELAGSAAGLLAQHAAGDARATPLQMTAEPAGGSGGAGAGTGGAGDTTGTDGNPAGPAPPTIDIDGATWAQKEASARFSPAGDFSGRTIDDVAADLRTGRMRPEDVPIDVIRRDGNVLILNTRSSLALAEADVPRSSWKIVDRTGQAAYERRLTRQLAGDELDSRGVGTIRVRGRN